MTKPNYDISFGKYLYHDNHDDIRDSKDIILQNPILLRDHKDFGDFKKLKVDIITHIGTINNGTILEYSAAKNTSADKVLIKIPTYPMLPILPSYIESVKRDMLYRDIIDKYKNKELDRYIEKVRKDVHLRWRIYKTEDNNIIVNNCFLIHNNHVYFPDYIIFPFVESVDKKEFVLDTTFDKSNNTFTIYCNMMFKKDISIS